MPPLPPDEGPPAKKASIETKRTLWKCKKCNFRDPQRELVLAHVKQHYQQRAQASAAVNSLSLPLPDTERHCRLKHEGNIHIVTAPKCPGDSGVPLNLDSFPQKSAEEESEGNDAELRNEPLQCATCPYSCYDVAYMSQHQQNHQPQAGAIFKCYLCPYYVVSKVELHDHLQLHGVSEPEEHLSRTLQQTKGTSCPVSLSKVLPNDSEIGSNDSGSNALKRYRCAGCPYVSNSKSQFLYHKQFHRPRGAPFKCGLCSYSVGRRHLLHQHLKVHGVLIPPQRSPGREPMDTDGIDHDGLEEGEEEAATSGAFRTEMPDLDTRQLPDVPLVWVFRNGRFDKLFKCRWCPHVNQRKANIIEHEKMHRRDEVEDHSEGDESCPSPRPLPPHRCPLCNYGCHNAGVLSAHMKVHQGAYGTVRALVDTTRSDEAQLEELGAATDCLPPMLLPQNADEPSHAIEEGQEETQDFRIENSDQPPSLEEECATEDTKMLYFCQKCPARFLVEKELNIHKRFHEIRLMHRCESCSYTARQRPHLLAHLKVHSDEYQERTEALASAYTTSASHPRPRTAVIVEGPGVSGPVWVVVSGGLSTGPAAPPELEDDQGLEDVPPPPPRPNNKHFPCPWCPAKFFKTVALEYHKSLHGGEGTFSCRFCNYRVKTYGNLVKHQMVHEIAEEAHPQPCASTSASTSTSTSTPAIPSTSSAAIPSTSTAAIPSTSTAAIPSTSTAAIPSTSTAAIPSTSTAAMDSIPSTSTAAPPSAPRGKSTAGVPLSGTDLFRQRAEAQRQGEAGPSRNPADLPVDPQFGILMHGSPEFVYPMYLKNGKLKEKRYKCHKCPSAFEKREQYKVHVSLHGSKQRYKCEKCDYSVKYYANFIQHLRKHQRNDEAQAARSAAAAQAAANDQGEAGPSGEPSRPRSIPQRSTKSIGSGTARKQTLSAAHQQSLMLQEARERHLLRSEEDKKALFRCAHCPYASARRDGLESHTRRHTAVSGTVGAYACEHCDYSAPQQHFLRDHVQLHFDATRRLRPEAYAHVEKLQIWVRVEGAEDQQPVLLFQDLGPSGSTDERFYPGLPPEVQNPSEVEEELTRHFVDLRTGEPWGGEKSEEGGSNNAQGKENDDESGAGNKGAEGRKSETVVADADPGSKLNSDEESVNAPKLLELKVKSEPPPKCQTGSKGKPLSERNKKLAEARSRNNANMRASEENGGYAEGFGDIRNQLNGSKIPASGPDIGESSSCDSSSSNSSSGSSSSSSSSSGSSSSSSTNDDSKSSDSSSESDSEESGEQAPNGLQAAASPGGTLSSDADVA